MIAEILAAIAVITVLVVLLLLAVMNERLTRSVAVLRHVRTRYTQPVAAFLTQWERIVTWSDDRRTDAAFSPVLRASNDQGYTAANDT